jgi:hypothetical protein
LFATIRALEAKNSLIQNVEKTSKDQSNWLGLNLKQVCNPHLPDQTLRVQRVTHLTHQKYKSRGSMLVNWRWCAIHSEHFPLQ